MRIVIAEEETKKRLTYRLRFEVMCLELGWLSGDEYHGGIEHDEYDSGQSLPFLAIDQFGQSVGTSRLILPGEHPFPVETHFNIHSPERMEKEHGELNYCVEVSRFVVPDNPALKNHEITMMLCRAMIKKSLEMGVSHMLMSTDYRFFRLLKILGFQLEEIGEPKDYMGSKTIPGILPLRNLLPKLKDNKPFLYKYLTATEERNMEMAVA